MNDPKPTTSQVEIEKRRRLLERAEAEAWKQLERAVGPDNRVDHLGRRAAADHAASLFTCVAAIAGQPVQVVSVDASLTTTENQDDA